MKRLHSMTVIALAGLVGLGTICAPIAASASEEGKRNTTYALGAAALGLLLTQKNKLPGLLAAGGAAYAYTQYNNDIQARHRREQDGYYDNRDHRQNNGYRYQQNNNWNRRDNGSQSHWSNNRNSSWNNRNADQYHVSHGTRNAH